MEFELGKIQEQFAELIWENEPISSGELVQLSSKKFGWKKSTTYTVLKKLCEKGLFQNNVGVVTSLISKEEFIMQRSEELVHKSFGGSLPMFVSAFISKNRLSASDVEALQKMIDKYREKQK